MWRDFIFLIVQMLMRRKALLKYVFRFLPAFVTNHNSKITMIIRLTTTGQEEVFTALKCSAVLSEVNYIITNQETYILTDLHNLSFYNSTFFI